MSKYPATYILSAQYPKPPILILDSQESHLVLSIITEDIVLRYLSKNIDMASSKVAEKSNFAQTCSFFSQYMKERDGALVDFSFGFDGKSKIKGPEASRAAATTLDLLPKMENNNSIIKSSNSNMNPAAATSQMTILYGGQVIVFDDFPADKAKEIMDLALSNANRSTSTNAFNLSPQSANPKEEALGLPPPKSCSGLPIARRASLHRFFEKRKDRVASRSPYERNGPFSKEEGPRNSRVNISEDQTLEQLELKL